MNVKLFIEYLKRIKKKLTKQRILIVLFSMDF